jgi:hypothetical protein
MLKTAISICIWRKSNKKNLASELHSEQELKSSLYDHLKQDEFTLFNNS